MGTWGTGPFDSDLAEDFVDRLEKHSAGQRAELIRARLIQAWAGPSDELPGEVLAAAAVVAAGLPSGRELPWNEDYPGVTDWLRGTDVPELAAVADRALERHFPADGWYWKSWTDESERSEAHDAYERLRQALRTAPRSSA